MQSRWFEFGGDTIIRADQYAMLTPAQLRLLGLINFTYRYIRLTSDRPSQSGWLFSKLPLTATNWEVIGSVPGFLYSALR